MSLTKEQVLENLDQVKNFVNEIESEKEVKKTKIQIKHILGSILWESEKETIKKAVIEAKNSGADLRGADLYGADLRGADLYGADLYGADLRGANLYGADLRGANLRGADLYGADLYGADLRGANLRGADLYGAELQNVKFYGKTTTPKILTKKQVPDFLAALGFTIE